MTHEHLLDAYAQLTIKSGLNLQRGQQLLITAPLDAVPLVRRITEHAYKAGASLVTAVYADDETTLARYRPRNLLHIVFDNGSLLSTGGFATHTTSGLTDLALIARGAGCPHVDAVNNMYDFMEAAADAFDRNDLSVIVAKVEAVGPDHFGMDLKLPENAIRFERYIRERKKAKRAA